MKARLARMFPIVLLFIPFLSPMVQAHVVQVGITDNEYSRATLKGITAVCVVVLDIPMDSAKVLGLSKDTIQTDVELKLRLAGMHVVTVEEVIKSPGGPFVSVQVNLTPNAQAASIEVELDQGASLKRTAELAYVRTWGTGVLLANPSPQIIRDKVNDRVDQFLNAWLSVNPK